MDARFSTRTRNTIRALEPGAWWTVEDVALSGPGFVLYYRLASHEGRPAAIRDDRERTALESFGSLPLEAMSSNLEAYRASLRGVPDARWDADRVGTIIAPLDTFVRKFGPIGIGWGGEFGVANPEADTLRRECERARWTALGFDPDTVPPTSDSGSPFWTVDFWGHAPGRGAVPNVQRRRWFPDHPWPERVRLEDDGVPHDNWLQIVDEYTDLHKTLRLVDAIARRDQFACRAGARAFFRNDDAEFWVGEPGPLRPDFGRAVRGVRPASGRVKLFRLPGHQVDWVAWSRRFLADLIGRQIDFTMPLIDVSEAGGLAVRWKATSILEVIYLQLLDHVQRHPDFGIGWCGKCLGPILRTRPPGVTGNRWHPRCRGGRVIEWRRAHPDWRSSRSRFASRA